MSMDPLQFRRARPAPDPAVGHTDPNAPPERAGDGLLEHRAVYAPVTDWSTLGRNERAFVDTILAYLYRGKGALVRSFAVAQSRYETAHENDLDALYERVVDHQTSHVRAIETLRRRFRETAPISDPEQEALRPVVEFMNAVAQPIGSAEHQLSEPRELSASALALSLIAFGVASQTGYRVLTVFLRRNGLLEECADLLETLQRSDQELAEALLRFRRDLQRTAPTFDDLVRERLEGCVVACTDVVRRVQDRFDFLSLGLVPDEFVAFTLDRYFEIGASEEPVEPEVS